jgi:hypothetical protein
MGPLVALSRASDKRPLSLIRKSGNSREIRPRFVTVDGFGAPALLAEGDDWRAFSDKVDQILQDALAYRQMRMMAKLAAIAGKAI